MTNLPSRIIAHSLRGVALAARANVKKLEESMAITEAQFAVTHPGSEVPVIASSLVTNQMLMWSNFAKMLDEIAVEAEKE